MLNQDVAAKDPAGPAAGVRGRDQGAVATEESKVDGDRYFSMFAPHAPAPRRLFAAGVRTCGFQKPRLLLFWLGRYLGGLERLQEGWRHLRPYFKQYE